MAGEGGMCGWGRAWLGGHVWLGGMCGWGTCMAGEAWHT